MPHETYLGPDIPGLMQRARLGLGADAVVLSVRRLDGDRGFELVAADEAFATATAARGSRIFSRAARLDDAGLTLAARSRRPRPAFDARLSSMLPALGDYGRRPRNEPAFLALVGPTGSGKTTTLAKLARHPQVFDGLPVGLLCLDTYRIGAVEQLAIYADLAGLPIEVAYEMDDLERAVRRLSDCELVLVDTAGRGPSGVSDQDATRRQLARLEPVEVHLTLPSGLRPDLARALIARHRLYGLTHVIATKRDEFPEDTSAFELADEHGLPMRWITTGQEVPHDLESAAPWRHGAVYATASAA